MTKLTWNDLGSHKFDSGLDQGVLYLSSGLSFPWTGLLSIDENFSDSTVNPLYYDGIKTRDTQVPGDFSATLKALAYPDALLDLIGVREIDTGVFVDGQQPKIFNFAYRTLIGNDVSGINHGYKIHLLYNLTAITDSRTYATLSASTEPSEINLTLYGVPDKTPNYRPTAHVILDSTQMSPDILESLEAILYGDETNDPRFPSIEEMIQLVLFFDPKLIIPHTDTGFAELVSGYGDLTQTNVQGIYFGLPENRLVPSQWDGYYWLEAAPNPTTKFWFGCEGAIPSTFVQTTDQYGTPFHAVSAAALPYASPGKNSNTGITVPTGDGVGHAQWNNDVAVTKGSVGFWFKPVQFPSVDARILDLRETSAANTLGGILYTSTGIFRIMQVSSGLSTGQSAVMPAGVWYWVAFTWNATTKIARIVINDALGTLLHDSGNVALTTAYANFKTARFVRPVSYDIGASSWDMFQYEPDSDTILTPWLLQ
jgi:hypothetical protein